MKIDYFSFEIDSRVAHANEEKWYRNALHQRHQIQQHKSSSIVSKYGVTYKTLSRGT